MNWKGSIRYASLLPLSSVCENWRHIGKGSKQRLCPNSFTTNYLVHYILLSQLCSAVELSAKKQRAMMLTRLVKMCFLNITFSSSGHRGFIHLLRHPVGHFITCITCRIEKISWKKFKISKNMLIKAIRRTSLSTSSGPVGTSFWEVKGEFVFQSISHILWELHCPFSANIDCRLIQ